jgi:hypothetical protein
LRRTSHLGFQAGQKSPPIFDPDNKNARLAENAAPREGNGLFGQDPTKSNVVVAANGGSDLVYQRGKDRKLAERIIEAEFTPGFGEQRKRKDKRRRLSSKRISQSECCVGVASNSATAPSITPQPRRSDGVRTGTQARGGGA